MKDNDILQYVEQVHNDRKIDKEDIFRCLEEALAHADSTAARPGERDEAPLQVYIDRSTGEISAFRDSLPLSQADLRGRVGATISGQVLKQKIREAEHKMIYDKFLPFKGQIVVGEARRREHNVEIVALDSIDAILPGAERIPKETFRPGQPVTALVWNVEMKPKGVKVVLSRSRKQFVQRLCELQIPEIKDGTIEIKGIEREPGKRTKVAVASHDSRIDVVGACVGQRGARSRAITDELGGSERIDFVVWDDDPRELIRNALKPADIRDREDVMLCHKLGRAIVLVDAPSMEQRAPGQRVADQRSLAIGRGGQNVRLACRISGWDIDVMTRDELEKVLDEATSTFMKIDGITREIADALVSEGFFSVDDLSIIEPDDFVQISGLDMDAVNAIVERADELVAENEERERLERLAKDEERRAKERNSDEL